MPIKKKKNPKTDKTGQYKTYGYADQQMLDQADAFSKDPRRNDPGFSPGSMYKRRTLKGFLKGADTLKEADEVWRKDFKKNLEYKTKGYKKGGTAHPGFKAVQSKIAAKQGVSKKAAGAILAASTRKASAKAKAANPRLKRVKG